MTIRTVESWHAGLVLARTPEELAELYATLPVPDPGSIAGEYAGYAHLGSSPASAAIVHGYVHDRDGKGYWLGKSFGLFDGTHGEGYNRLLQQDGRVRRCERFRTSIGPSLIDDRPTFLIEYAPYRNAPASAGFVDEVRELEVGRYLLLATTPTESGGRTAPAVMYLEGPVSPWVGVDADVDEARS